MKKTVAAIGVSLALAGCGTMNNALVEKKKAVEYYRIFDIKTGADRHTVAEAASNGLGRNVNSANEALPIPNFSEPPEKPGRFTLKDPLANTNLAILAGARGGGSLGFKMATCDGAIWTATANRSTRGSSSLQLTACLWQYQGGYHLDTYANFQKVEGGFAQISRDMAGAMVGTPEQWTEKTFLDIVRSIRKATGAEIVFVEGYPKLAGTPWLDEYDQI